MNNNYEKLVKSALKQVAKVNELDYEKLKTDAKKIIKLAKTYDEQLLGMMEELLDLNNVSCEEELVDFDVDVLKIYCRIKEIELDGSSDRSIRRKVWENIELENEVDDESDDSDESNFIEEESETEPEPEPEPEPVVVKEKKKSKKTAVVVVNE
jgi:hypothetical protein